MFVGRFLRPSVDREWQNRLQELEQPGADVRRDDEQRLGV
jgi:hypothetical protein